MKKIIDIVVDYLEYLKLLIMPTVVGLLGSLLWLGIHKSIEFSRNDVGIFEIFLGVVCIAHGMISSLQIQKVANKQDYIYQALETKNRKLFIETQCLKINPVIKFLLLIFSAIFFIMFLLFPFQENYAGFIVVFLSIFILYLLWEVAVELDGLYHGIWKISKKRIIEVFGEDLSNGKAQ